MYSNQFVYFLNVLTRKKNIVMITMHDVLLSDKLNKKSAQVKLV